MADARFARSPVATVTITGVTSVGGTADTVISLHADSTIRFVDANGVTQIVPVPHFYTTAFKNRIQPSSGTAKDGPVGALFSLFEVLDRRATP